MNELQWKQDVDVADITGIVSDMTAPSNMVVVLLTAGRKPWSETKEIRLLSTSVMSTVAS